MLGTVGCGWAAQGGGVVELTVCPECGEVAEVQWRAVLESTDGPIEHARTMCVQRHWFFLPVERLTSVAAVQGQEDRPARRPYGIR